MRAQTHWWDPVFLLRSAGTGKSAFNRCCTRRAIRLCNMKVTVYMRVEWASAGYEWHRPSIWCIVCEMSMSTSICNAPPTNRPRVDVWYLFSHSDDTMQVRSTVTQPSRTPESYEPLVWPLIRDTIHLLLLILLLLSGLGYGSQGDVRLVPAWVGTANACSSRLGLSCFELVYGLTHLCGHSSRECRKVGWLSRELACGLSEKRYHTSTIGLFVWGALQKRLSTLTFWHTIHQILHRCHSYPADTLSILTTRIVYTQSPSNYKA